QPPLSRQPRFRRTEHQSVPPRSELLGWPLLRDQPTDVRQYLPVRQRPAAVLVGRDAIQFHCGLADRHRSGPGLAVHRRAVRAANRAGAAQDPATDTRDVRAAHPGVWGEPALAPVTARRAASLDAPSRRSGRIPLLWVLSARGG